MGFLIWYIVYSAYICDIMEERKWFEELPDLCPPSDAMACSGVFYRIAEGDPVKSLDSSRKEDGMIKKTFGVAHYSWWRSYCFDVNKAKVMML